MKFWFAFLMAGLVVGCQKEVEVKVRDPRLKIEEAHLWHWQTNVAFVSVTTHPILRQLDDYRCKVFRKLGARHRPIGDPIFDWRSGPNRYHPPRDVLCLFGTYPIDIGPMGFELVMTNGVICNPFGSAVEYGRIPGRLNRTNFGSASRIQTNLHGFFWLRLHGETNVVADILIR